MKKKLPNLDPLRAFLAISVVLFHIPVLSKTLGLPYNKSLPIFHKGHEAVWVFFCLSGFLIIRSLFEEKQSTNSISVKNFYLRRIVRIYPVYYLVMFFGFFFYDYLLPFFNIPYETNYTLAEGIALCIGFLPNVFKELYKPGGILIILWSIGIEEQFYLFIAPISKYLKLTFFKLFLFSFSVVYFILYFSNCIPELKKFDFLFFYFSISGLLSILNYEKKINFLTLPLLLRIMLYSTFLTYFFTDILVFENKIYNHLLSATLFPITILNLANEDLLIIKNKVFIYLGRISYGIYMYHMIALNVVLFLFTRVELLQFSNTNVTIASIIICTLSLTILISSISFHYFEAYFLSLKSRLRKTTSEQ